MLKTLRNYSLAWAWRGLVFLLPFTSVPIIVRLVGSDTVAAPSGILLAYLVVMWLIPAIFYKVVLPRQIIPILFFVLAAVISTALAFFILLPSYKDVNIVAHDIQALITLSIGVCFFLVFALYPKDIEQVRMTLRWINRSGVVIIIWSFIQAYAYYRFRMYPAWMEVFHRSLSSGILYTGRVCGFAYEPSWLAHQLNMLYLPLWGASVVTGYSAHRFRVLGMPFELFLLFGGVGALFLTFSRVGYLAFLLMLTVIFVRLNRRLVSWVLKRFFKDPGDADNASDVHGKRRLLTWLFSLLLIIVYIGILIGAAYGVSLVDPRMREIFNFDLQEDNIVLRYGIQLNMGARLVYWFAGLRVFNDYPLFGVGLGNVGLFFQERIPSFGWNVMEVREILQRSSHLVNSKSLWVRLLSETGIVGFSMFGVWLYGLFHTAIKLQWAGNKLFQTIGLMGLLVLAGLIMEGFSIDSFALPYLWVSMGLLTVVYKIGAVQNGVD